MAQRCLKLFVHIIGLGTSSFPVSIKRSETVCDLKEAILKKNPNNLKDIEADQLILYKVALRVPDGKDSELEQLAERAEKERIPSSREISRVFPMDPQGETVSVLVEAPNIVPVAQLPHKPHQLGDPDWDWLIELYSKIWNRPSLKPTIFRKVKVTRAGYATLQERLKDLHSDRDSQDYNGANDVLSVKLDVLRSPILSETLSPRDPDTDDESNKDDPDLKSLFPSIISYMDLSALKLKVPPPRIPLALLIRQDYKDLSEFIKTMPPNGAGSVVVSGQPGIGKTAYLYLRIIENMIEGRPFLYQGLNGTVFHVGESGVKMIWMWLPSKPIVAFIDGEKGDCEPQFFLCLPSVQLIVASYPKSENKKWLDQTGPSTFVATFVAKLWSYKELLLTGIFLHPNDLSSKLLRDSTRYFGNNPHRCFRASTSHFAFEIQKSSVVRAIYDAVQNEHRRIMNLLSGARTGDSEVSHKIFQIFPDVSRLLPNCQVEAVSRWALDFLLEQYEVHMVNMAANFYYRILLTHGETLVGQLFERQVLNYLSRIDTECLFDIRGLAFSETETMRWTYRGPIPLNHFQDESGFGGEITKAVKNRKSLHLIRFARNFPASDSIIYDPNDPNAPLTYIRITTNMDHKISVSGLKRIQSWLHCNSPLADLRPTKTKPWRFIFIVPFNKASAFKLQKLAGDTDLGEWAGKVDQCVLGLEDRTIFGEKPKSLFNI